MNTASTILTLSDGSQIAYHQLAGKSQVGVVFLGGFMSDMQGTKATFLETVCQRLDVPFVRFDYFGHGLSPGKLEEGGIGRWKNNALAVLDQLTEGPQILVGSSMGGWLMVLAALERKERIKGLIGIAAAPDFVKDFSRLTAEQQQVLDKDGICYLPSHYGAPYPISRHLLDDGFRHCILDKPIPLQCPVRLLHGLADEQVSWQQSLRLAECLESQDIDLTLIKSGDHRLSNEKQLGLLAQALADIL